MSSTPVSVSAITNTVNTDFTLQSWITELNSLETLLEGVIRVKVLATLILDYSGLDGRQRVYYFLDRKLSPSPSFVLNYEPTIWSFRQLFDVAVPRFVNLAEPEASLYMMFEERTARVILNDQKLIEVESEDGHPLNICEKAANQALQVIRGSQAYSRCLFLQDLEDLPCVQGFPKFSNDLAHSGLSTAQIKWINDSKEDGYDLSNYCKVLFFKALSCQKPLDLQFVMQNKVEEVICHLKLNGLPLHGTSDPGRGITEEEAINDVLTKSSQYLLEMTSALTHREFRIIETELVRRYVHDHLIKANILQHNCSVDLM